MPVMSPLQSLQEEGERRAEREEKSQEGRAGGNTPHTGTRHTVGQGESSRRQYVTGIPPVKSSPISLPA